ncbi:MAG: S1 family peptidase [Polyangiaceae bacterium]
MKRAAALAGIALTACEGSDRRAASPIIGGAPSNDAAVVLLVSYPKDQSVLDTCTAAVIAPSVLVTAAHCVDPMTHPDHVFGVFAGPDATAFATPQTIAPKLVSITKATLHPDYDRKAPFHADIAVVELASPLAVPPLPFARAPLDASIVGAEARIVGYGETHYDTPNYAQQSATTTIAKVDPDDTLTVGDGAHRSCVGDSGGPALVSLGGVETIVGIDSYADLAGCLEPAHYRRVDVYADFLAPFAPVSGEGGSGGATSSSSSSAGGSAADGDGDAGGCAVAVGARATTSTLALAAALLALGRRARRRSS